MNIFQNVTNFIFKRRFQNGNSKEKKKKKKWKKEHFWSYFAVPFPKRELVKNHRAW